MCGIAGIINPRGPASVQPAVESILHRGPHDLKYWSDTSGSALLGHSRLCVIDTGEGGAQPRTHGDDYALIYNGEIYNYKELRQELSQSGYVFTSQSDTEVVLAAYIVWGEECVQRFDGMFAFAIWNRPKQYLFAGRDRFGEKPFFFHYDGQTLSFASEIKALWKLGIEREVNPSMLYNFISFGLTANPGDPSETFFSGIQKLPAASTLRFSSRSNQLEIHKYWQLSIETPSDQSGPPLRSSSRSLRSNAFPSSISDTDQALQTFSGLLTDSVSKRLRSDVSIGTSLSGGLDSSAIAAIAKMQRQEQYAHHAFTASFPNETTDESGFAAKVAGALGMQHTIVPVTGENLPARMERMMRIQDEPFSSSSVLAQYEVFKAASAAGMTVMLDGQGADEILAGYHQYYRWWWRELYAKGLLKKSGAITQAYALGIRERFTWKDRIAAMLPDFTGALWQTKKSKSAAKNSDLHPDFLSSRKYASYYTLPAHHTLNGILYHHTIVNGLEELLRLADRNSMANGIEVRLPYLSHELVEYLFTLPADMKIHDGWTKWLLRKSVEKILPPEIVWRKDKLGFEPPQQQWMSQPDVQESMREGKRRLVHAGILTPVAADKMIQPHSAYAADQREWRYWSASFLFMPY